MHKILFLILLIISAIVWLAVVSVDNNLKVIACDVGQGDAILITHNFDQILIDGGPDNKVLDCLGKYMPFWDRQIELVILTHPDTDHSGGLPEVFKRYSVNTFLTNDITQEQFSNKTIQVLAGEVGGKGITVIHPSDTPAIRLGLIHLDILHPSLGFTDKKTNNYSIATLLDYGQFEAIFTGDIEDAVSDLISKKEKIQDVDYIKVPHHGSKNGLSEELLKVAKPEIGVISVAAKNSYGHPHQEVLDLLQKYNVKVMRTDQNGDAQLITDQYKYWVKD